jgi:hypothetical protein
VGDEAHATSVVLVRGVVQALRFGLKTLDHACCPTNQCAAVESDDSALFMAAF